MKTISKQQSSHNYHDDLPQASSHMNQRSISHNSRFSSIQPSLDKDGKASDSDKHTFVTGLHGATKQPHEEVQEQLEECVDNIQNQFQNVLSRHDNDFLTAYQGFMLKVQKELVFLKNKANETAGKILNDDQITNLQSQILKFKDEAEKLDTFLEKQKREVQKQKTRELNINEDRKFLKEQTLEAMKNNRLLEIALRKTQRQNKLIKEFLAKNNIKVSGPQSPTNNQAKGAFITQQEKVNMAPTEYKNNLTKLIKLKAKKQNCIPQELLSQESQDFRIKEFVLDLFKRNYNREKIEFKIAKFFKLYDLSRDEQIAELQKRLNTVKKNNLRLKSAKANDFAERSEIENLFLDSVEEWKKEVLRRTNMKSEGAEATNYGLPSVIIEKLVSNKELLITFFEEMFGSGGFIGSTISSLEHHMRNKKYSLAQADMQHSYFSNATTKDNCTSDEYASQRVNMIMNAPIETLMNNMSQYSQSQTRLGFRSGSAYTDAPNKPRASTAIAQGQRAYHNQTALTADTNQLPAQIKIQGNARAMTSHSNARKIVNAKSKSRQISMGYHNSKDRSFSVRNGKLVMNQTFMSNNPPEII